MVENESALHVYKLQEVKKMYFAEMLMTEYIIVCMRERTLKLKSLIILLLHC